MKAQANIRKIKRDARHERIRKKVFGTPEQPRLYVYRSLKNFYAQIIDDTTGQVLLGVSTLNKDVRKHIKSGGNKEAAIQLGKVVASLGQSKGIKKVCFDRGGNYYHGRVKAFAEAAREGGFEF